jgi:hypothetical protein
MSTKTTAHTYLKFQKQLIERSDADNYEDALDEWYIISGSHMCQFRLDTMEKCPLKDVPYCDKCICEVKIVEQHYVMHRKTHEVIVIGSTCIANLMKDCSEKCANIITTVKNIHQRKTYHTYKKVKSSYHIIWMFATGFSLFNKTETSFFKSMLGQLHMSQKQKEWFKKLNKRAKAAYKSKKTKLSNTVMKNMVDELVDKI